MIQIRNGIFETNSSSVHAICIAKPRKNSEFEFPTQMDVSLGNYGWDFSVLNTPSSRAAYAYTLAKDIGKAEEVKQCIFDICCETDVDVYFDVNNPNFSYVDHAYDAEDFISDMLKNKRKFKDYLFGTNSRVFTGNDNSDYLGYMGEDVHAWKSENPSGVIYWK